MRNKKGFTLVEVMIVIVIIGTLCLIPLYVKWTDSNLDYAITWLKNKPVNVPMWLSAIFAIATNGFGLAFNIIVALLR